MEVYKKKIEVHVSSKKEAVGDVKHAFSFTTPNTCSFDLAPLKLKYS